MLNVLQHVEDIYGTLVVILRAVTTSYRYRRVYQSGCTKLSRWNCKTGRETRSQIQTMKVSTKPACPLSSHR